MAREKSSSLSKWARSLVVGSSIAVAIALISTAWLGLRRTDQASEVLSIGQASSFMRALGEHVRMNPEPSEADLADFLTENEQFGVRFIEIRTRDGARRAGTPAEPLGSVGAGRGGPPHELTRVGNRVRLVGRAPPPRHGPPPDSFIGRPPELHGRGPHHARGGGHMVLEFEPIIANRLHADAQRALIVNSVVAAVFLLVSVALWRLLRQREAIEARAEHERQLSMLGAMSAVMAHEIRNPLTSLKGHAQLLAEQLEAGSGARKKADRVVHEAERIEALTSSLLDLVRSGSVERRLIDPAELLASSAESISGRVELDTANAPPRFSLDPLRMQQVFTNLLENAAEASADGPVEVQLGSEHGALAVTIRDHGPGIPAGEEERIFQAFHTTRTRGTGLGLAVARRIVELHGGSIAATNHPGGGASFRILIPKES